MSYRCLQLSALIILMLQVRIAAQTRLDGNDLLERRHVVQVEIEMPQGDWSALCEQRRDFRTAFTNPNAKPYTYFKADIKIDGVMLKQVGIRKKGFIGSQDTIRPSLKLQFDKYVDQRPVDGLDTMTLNNNKQDLSLLSQCLSYQLFRKAGVHAPRCTYATVTVNGDYLGIYSHVESIKEPFLKNEFNDGSGKLYEGTLADFYPKAIDRLEAKNAASNEDRSKVLRLAHLLAADGPLKLGEVEAIVDVDNFLRFWVIESLIGCWDGYTQNQNNYFVYESPQNGKLYFVPWGADSCFSAGRGFGRFGGNRSNVVSATSMLANRLYHTEGIPSRYRETLDSILKDVWDEEELLAETDRILELIRNEFDEQQLDAFRFMKDTRRFIQQRRATVLDELERDWPVRVDSPPRKPMYTVEVGQSKGNFRTLWKGPDQGTGRAEITLDGSELTIDSMVVIAEPMQQRGFGFPTSRTSSLSQPASIILRCPRSNASPITMTLNIPRDRFNQTGERVEITGSFSDTDQTGFFGIRGAARSIDGYVKLSEASLQDGEPIVGQFDLKIVEMRGGFMDRGRR